MRKLILLVLVAACGGVDDPCPTDDCELKGRTVIKWTFNAYPERGFPMDSCVDFGVHKVAVDLVDINGLATSGQDDCGAAQATFSGLAPGDYDVYVMPLDAAGNPILAFPRTGKVTAGTLQVPQEATINVPWDAWPGTHTGTFLFRISWGGLSCEAVLPEIKNQVLTLAVNGVVQNIMTDDGQMLNGADKKPCKRLTDNFPQSALNAPFGPATLLIEGYDETDMMKFSKQFDTFVGAGITNPTLTFDVPLM
ncbi:MAG TPA: hypothetical protein VIV11_31870 [Kofleriaceae bacterium]